MSKNFSEPASGDELLASQAAAWVLRCDRGLSPAEQDEFSAWLAADPRHGAQLARHRRHWRRLNALAEWRPEHTAQPNPDLLAPPLRARLRRWAPVSVALATAAAVTLGLFLVTDGFERRDAPGAPVARSGPAKPAATGPMVLADGSRVELNRGAQLSIAFTPTERRVRLTSGEAHFDVEKDLARPFIVNAAGIDVRAVGTAFNVRIDPHAVEVLVTEGTVRVDETAGANPNPAAPETAPLAVLEARQRAVVPLNQAQQAPPPQIATLTPGEIERVLAWQHRLLDFNATPLHEVVAEFNRRNVVQLLVIDPELAATRVRANLRSDNIDGFVRLLEAGFGVRSEKRGDTEILLRKAR